jgi:hypothetical protein
MPPGFYYTNLYHSRWGGKKSSVLGEWITAVMCMIAWVIGEPIGFADTNVGTEIMVFPILGWIIFFDRKSE